MRRFAIILLIFALLCEMLPLQAQNESSDKISSKNFEYKSTEKNSKKLSPQKIFYFKIDDNISRPSQRKLNKAIEQATAQDADILFMELNTFGGELDAADKMRTALLECPIPTIVFINKNAASAGALISIACDSIYMAPGSSIGAASVVDQTGQVLPDKYQSYMRSLMRSTAEMNGRDPDIAQAMVDPDVEIKGVSEKGKVLTFTTSEAIENGFCNAEANDMDEVLKKADIQSYTIENQQESWIDKVISFLINPIVSGILIMFIIGGIYFEMQAPGIGFALLVSVVAALLYFAPHYLEGLAAHWEILVFIVGLGLLLLEIFVVPGFGVTGISGIILMVAALVLTMTFNIGFDFSFSAPELFIEYLFLVIAACFAGFLLSLWLGKKLITADTRYGSLALKTNMDTDKGFVAQDMQLAQYVGKQGIASTLLRPVGKIEIDGEYLDATSEVGFIDKGDPIEVTRFENAQLFVKRINN
jgi:membrane-bound serine protease (ClpP class)